MKKIVFLSLLLINMYTYSQGAGAYKELKPVKNEVPTLLQDFSKDITRNMEAAKERREKNFKIFNKTKKNALKSFSNKDYSRCVYYYESSKNLGWHDAEFEYVTGVSYYYLSEKLNKKKYKSKAKRLLKLSKKHGFIDGELFLDKHF